MTSSKVNATENTPSLSDSMRCKLQSAVMSRSNGEARVWGVPAEPRLRQIKSAGRDRCQISRRNSQGEAAWSD